MRRIEGNQAAGNGGNLMGIAARSILLEQHGIERSAQPLFEADPFPGEPLAEDSADFIEPFEQFAPAQHGKIGAARVGRC